MGWECFGCFRTRDTLSKAGDWKAIGGSGFDRYRHQAGSERAMSAAWNQCQEQAWGEVSAWFGEREGIGKSAAGVDAGARM